MTMWGGRMVKSGLSHRDAPADQHRHGRYGRLPPSWSAKADHPRLSPPISNFFSNNFQNQENFLKNK
jgi:hypothetical protein